MAVTAHPARRSRSRRPSLFLAALAAALFCVVGAAAPAGASAVIPVSGTFTVTPDVSSFEVVEQGLTCRVRYHFTGTSTGLPPNETAGTGETLFFATCADLTAGAHAPSLDWGVSHSVGDGPQVTYRSFSTIDADGNSTGIVVLTGDQTGVVTTKGRPGAGFSAEGTYEGFIIETPQ
jgi:hypothetical protein